MYTTFPNRVGIFGGSFNPIHNGHLLCAERAAEQLKLDIVLFMPNFCSPQKRASDYASPMDRLYMISKALQGNYKFYSCPLEVEQTKPCYTVDTLKKFEGRYAIPPYWLCGQDSLETMDTWKNPKGIMKLISGIGVFTQDIKTLRAPAYARAKVSPVYVPRLDIRSTSIRQRIIKGQSIKYMVPFDVADYIEETGLYRADSVSNKA